MSKWSNVHSFTTGLAGAMKAWNDADDEMLEKQFKMLEYALTANKIMSELEIAKMKVATGGMDPMDYVKLQQEQLKLNQQQELEKANNELIDAMVKSGRYTRPEAIRYIKAAQEARTGYEAQEAGKTFEAKTSYGQPGTTTVGGTVTPATVTPNGYYDIKTVADVKENMARGSKAQYEMAGTEAGIQKGVPQQAEQTKLITAQQEELRQPEMTKEQVAETKIKEVSAEYIEPEKKAQVAQMQAIAEYLSKHRIDLAESDQIINNVSAIGRLMEMKKKLTDAKRTGNSNIIASIISGDLTEEFPTTVFSKDPNLLGLTIDSMIDTLVSTNQGSINRIKETVPGVLPDKEIKYFDFHPARLGYDPRNNREITGMSDLDRKRFNEEQAKHPEWKLIPRSLGSVQQAPAKSSTTEGKTKAGQVKETSKTPTREELTREALDIMNRRKVEE